MKELIISNAPAIATIFVFSFFCLVIFSVFRKGSSKKFTQYSQIPLNDDFPSEKITKDKHRKN